MKVSEYIAEELQRVKTLPSGNLPVINIKDPLFGAVADGVTNDTPSLQKGIDYLEDGGYILCPPGEYALEDHFSVDSNIMLIGVKGRTIFTPTDTNTANPVLVEVNGKSNVTFYHIEVNGKYETHPNFNNVVTVFQSTDVLFDKCIFRDTKGVAVIFSTDIERSGVRDSYFNQCGIYNTISADPLDRKQSIAFSSGTQEGNKDNFAEGNTFEHCGLDCVSFSLQSNGHISRNNVHKNYSGSLYISNSINVRVTDNYVNNTETGGNGIDVANACVDVTVDGNTCTGNGASGILVSDATNVVVSNNTCTNNVQSATTVHRGGIVLSATTGNQLSKVEVTGNICGDFQGTKTQEYGVLRYEDGGTFSECYVGFDNILSGNLIADISDNLVQQFNDTKRALLDQDEEVDICANDQFGELTVIRLNDAQFGRIYIRSGQDPQVLYDKTGGIFQVTDTGTEIAVYNDGSRIKLKSKSASTGRLLAYKLEIY